MQRKILISMLIIALSAAMVGGATVAIFTAYEKTKEEVFKAGTVAIDVGKVIIPSIHFQNMAPGDEIDGSFSITNSGTLDLWYKVTAYMEGPLFKGKNGAQVIIHNPIGELGPKEQSPLKFVVKLPLDAGNDYQGAEGILQFIIHAEQLRNNIPSW